MLTQLLTRVLAWFMNRRPVPPVQPCTWCGLDSITRPRGVQGAEICFECYQFQQGGKP